MAAFGEGCREGGVVSRGAFAIWQGGNRSGGILTFITYVFGGGGCFWSFARGGVCRYSGCYLRVGGGRYVLTVAGWGGVALRHFGGFLGSGGAVAGVYSLGRRWVARRRAGQGGVGGSRQQPRACGLWWMVYPGVADLAAPRPEKNTGESAVPAMDSLELHPQGCERVFPMSPPTSPGVPRTGRADRFRAWRGQFKSAGRVGRERRRRLGRQAASHR